MLYNGRYEMFSPGIIRTYPVSRRINKVTLADLSDPAQIRDRQFSAGEAESGIIKLAECIIGAVRSRKPVILFTGAHLVKNGLGPVLVDLVRRGVLSLVATNGAGAIHDFELALLGQTSEHVPNALPEGQFGMATELGYINAALAEGQARQLGYGEVVGGMIHDAEIRTAVKRRLGLAQGVDFQHPQVSILAACYAAQVPLTVHVGIGTDVIDQHPNFDGAAKGGCSGRDFLIYTQMVGRLTNGGVILNVGSAVTGPEVLLKAVSMTANAGKVPHQIITADFDLKPYHPEAMTDEARGEYYFRHHKSVVTRIPEAFGGQGCYIQGDQRVTIPRLYQEIIKGLDKPR